MEWLDGNRIKVDPPKNPLKLTGTRFAAVLGSNVWKTPFEIFCEVTRTYKEPFVDTIYTAAGKIIEPKQAEYIAREYFWEKLKTPSDIFGEDYFKKTRGDFFQDYVIFGGMWDYLFVDKEGKPKTVLEMKTTKRVEDWQDDIPEYYALQAALYAYLLDVDDVIMVVSFLDEGDYKNPELFECTPENTTTFSFKVSERYPDFRNTFTRALTWWQDHVETGVSPEYDEKRDAEILKALRTNNLSPETDLSELVAEAEELKAKLDAHAAEVAEEEKRYKVVTDQIKKAAIEQFREGDKTVQLKGSRFVFEVSRSSRTSVDTDAMKNDGIYEKYTIKSDTYTIRSKVKEEET